MSPPTWHSSSVRIVVMGVLSETKTVYGNYRKARILLALLGLNGDGDASLYPPHQCCCWGAVPKSVALELPSAVSMPLCSRVDPSLLPSFSIPRPCQPAGQGGRELAFLIRIGLHYLFAGSTCKICKMDVLMVTLGANTGESFFSTERYAERKLQGKLP